MRRLQRLIRAITLAIAASGLLLVAGRVTLTRAAAASAPSLLIAQLKITSSNGQFVTLYNPTNGTLDMTHYELEYFNNYDLTKATSSRVINLTGSLPPHGYYMINDDELPLCYQMVINATSLGFSSTAGFIEVMALSQASPGAQVSPALQDFAGWSKTPTATTQTLPSNTSAFLVRQPVDTQNAPLVTASGTGSWLAVQPDPNQICHYVTLSAGTPVTTGPNQLLPTTEPPVTIINEPGNDSSAPASSTALPADDVGLMAPRITELLPNPAGTGNDATNEFIELYNPNTTSFDLTGFSLQTGLTTLHTYHFPDGASLPPQSFTAFYSVTTHLTMSNSGGQAVLVDPFGNSLSSSGVYSTASDGVAWALANGQWVWTTDVTPNAANIIKQPVKKATTKKSRAKAGSKTKAATAVKTKKAKKTSKPASLGSANLAQATTTPIHTWVLALVAGLALLYGAYEYRTDLANYYRKLAGYLGAGRANRKTPERGRDD